MAANSIGEADLIFGVTDDLWGYFESLDVSEAVDTVEAMDGDGDIKGVTFQSARHTVTGTFVHLTTVGPDSDDPRQQVGTGTAIEVTNASNTLPNFVRTTIYVTEATERQSNTDYMRCDFTGRMDANLGS